jgi:hypothetical protein
MGDTGFRLEFAGTPTGPDLRAVASAPVPLHPIKLDALVVADDPDFLVTLMVEANLRGGIANAIAAYYSA